MHWRSSALHALAEFEKSSKVQEPLISVIAFADDLTRLTTCQGGSFVFRNPISPDALARLAGTTAPTRCPVPRNPDAAVQWEQWYETLADLAGYPSYFEDSLPELVPNVIQRFSDCVIFSFRTPDQIRQYRYSFDDRNEFPLALPDEIRCSWLGDRLSGPFLEWV